MRVTDYRRDSDFVMVVGFFGLCHGGMEGGGGKGMASSKSCYRSDAKGRSTPDIAIAIAIANNRNGENSDSRFYCDRTNSADRSDYRFLKLSSILPATPPDIRNELFNLSLSYRFPIAIATSLIHTPDPWEAAIANARLYRDRNPLPSVSYPFPIASYRKV